jgi:hypothetical protein
MLIYHDIALSIENYENRTVAAISRNDNSVQQTIIDFGSHDAHPQNSTIPILKYPGKFDNHFLWHK